MGMLFPVDYGLKGKHQHSSAGLLQDFAKRGQRGQNAHYQVEATTEKRPVVKGEDRPFCRATNYPEIAARAACTGV